jgi:hypothetical protein
MVRVVGTGSGNFWSSDRKGDKEREKNFRPGFSDK